MAPRSRKRKSRNSPRLRRRGTQSKELHEVHHVYCEGKTEQRCLDALRGAWNLPRQRITVTGRVGVPWTIVERAKAKREEIKRLPKRPNIHVVFDRDEHPRFREAIRRARALGLSIGVSVPCFELWAILLHRDQTAPMDRHQAQSLLRKIHPGYSHDKNPALDHDAVLLGLDKARRRAELLARRAHDAGDEFANPTTTFSQVVDAIFPIQDPKSS